MRTTRILTTPRPHVRRLGSLALAAGLLIGASCGDDDNAEPSAPSSRSSADATATAPSEPVTIRMGWGIPAEEIKYLMMQRPELAPHLGTWYDIEWHEFAGAPPGVQGADVVAASAATTGVAADVLDGYLLADGDYFRPLHGAVDTAALQEEWDFFFERGVLEQRLDVDDHVIPELLEP